jgi:Fur family ferric uptake transcriptional regulator
MLTLLRSDRRYFTAAELYQVLKLDIPTIAMSTVYRALELLESLGTVSRRVEEGKEASFVYCGEEHHHHAICRTCGHVDDIRCDAIDQLRTSLEQQRGFELDEHTIEFYGRCARCKRDPSPQRHNHNGVANPAATERSS